MIVGNQLAEQMSRPDRMITTAEIRVVVMSGEIIEEYPEDKRGVSCLVSYATQNRPIPCCLCTKN